MTTAIDDELETTVSLTDEDPGEANPGGEDRGDIVAPEPVKKAKAEAVEPEEDEPADEEAEEPAVEKHAKNMPPMIPKARFDEVNDALKETRRQNELLLQAVAARPEATAAAPAPTATAAVAVDLDALEGEYVTALLDGDTDKAKELRKTIRAEEKRQAVAEAMESQEQVTVGRAFQAEVQSVYADYPQLNNKDEKADAAAIADVIDWRDYLVDRKGLPLHTALRQAAEKVATARGWDKLEAETPQPPSRTEAQRRRNAQTNLDQPPPLEGGVGERAGRARQTDVKAMSDDDFKALPEAEKKRLRGD